MILGLMSGTSLDGLDIALCDIHGHGANTKLQVLHFETEPYSADFLADIERLFAKETVSLKLLSAMNAKVARIHAQIIHEKLNKWEIEASQVDIIASHGQTIFHAPNAVLNELSYPNSTLQIGDGDHIAVLTKIITVSDFRQKHIAAGGEGAPLVAYGDYLLFSDPIENRILLNIGGISNLTSLPAGKQSTAVLSTDSGPGNTLLDHYMKRYLGLPYDHNGQLAEKGEVNEALFTALIAHPFFKKEFPKTTGPEEFNLDYFQEAKKISSTEHISHEDDLATLVSLTVYGIVSSIKEIGSQEGKSAIYLSGGGLHNASLVQALRKELTHYRICSTAELGMASEAKEAALFALLANETLVGTPTLFAEQTGAPAISLGKISFPI